MDENLKALQQKVELIGASPIDVNKNSPNFRIQDQTEDKEYHVCEIWEETRKFTVKMRRRKRKR